MGGVPMAPRDSRPRALGGSLKRFWHVCLGPSQEKPTKMDLGLRPARTAADRIRAGKAPLRLRLAQCLDVCDRLLRRYATWLAGHTLAQTVFDCLYLQKEGKKSWCSHLEGGGSGGRNRPPPVPLSRPPPSPSPPIFQLSLPVGLPK